jgi:hypothetical protein
MIRFLAHICGIDNASGGWYLWWSGFGGYTFVALAIIWTSVRKRTCHYRGCWRPGLHEVPDSDYIVCAKHFPGVPPSKPTLKELHNLFRASDPEDPKHH